MKAKKRILAVVTAAVLVLAISVTAYAAIGNQTVNRVGDNYIVDTVTAEKTVDGIVVQTIERKTIPSARFNPRDPRNPISSGTPTPTPAPGPDSEKIQKLRQAGIDSRNDLQTYAWAYQWTTTPVETAASDTKLTTNITFQVLESVSKERWKCTFNQVVTYYNGTPIVKYYVGNQEYSVASIKRMFEQYGRAK